MHMIPLQIGLLEINSGYMRPKKDIKNVFLYQATERSWRKNKKVLILLYFKI